MEQSEATGRLGVPKKVWLLGWISFLADVSSEIAYPITPIFLRTVLGAPFVFIGVIEGLADGTANVVTGWSGLRSDRTGKRIPFINWGYGLSACGKPMIGLATAWWHVVFARVFDRFGKGLRTTARDALIADLAPPDQRGRIFGLHRTMDTAGALVGVLTGLLLLSLLPEQYRLILMLAFIPGAVAWWLTMRVKETGRSAEPAKRENVSVKSLPKSFWWILLPNFVFGLANSSDAFLLLRARDQRLSDFAVILAYLAYNVTYVLVSYPAGRLSDKIGRWWLIGASWTLYALVYLGFAFFGGGAVWGLFLLYGCYIGVAKGVSKALVVDHAPPEAKGTALGVFNFATGIAAIAASVLTGVLVDRSGFSLALLACTCIAICAVLLIPLSLKVAHAKV